MWVFFGFAFVLQWVLHHTDLLAAEKTNERKRGTWRMKIQVPCLSLTSCSREEGVRGWGGGGGDGRHPSFPVLADMCWVQFVEASCY